MRVPLSWLRDFAPFDGDPAVLADTLDDLGLVVEETELVNEGLGDVVVVRVDRIDPIAGADRIRLVVVDDGTGPVEVVCGAWNFEVGDLVPLAPVGSGAPGRVRHRTPQDEGRGLQRDALFGPGAQAVRRPRGDHAPQRGRGGAPGRPLTEVLGIEPDVIFDIAVEANRPDAWSIAGVARDLAGRLGLPFAIPVTADLTPVAAAGAVAGDSEASAADGGVRVHRWTRWLPPGSTISISAPG